MKLAALLALCCLSACAQTPSLESKLQALAPQGSVWAQVLLPLTPGHGTICSHWHGEGSHSLNTYRQKILLDGPRQFRLLFRVHNGKVDRVSAATEDCAIEAGSQRLETLSSVTAEEVITYLASREDDSHLFALSLIDHPRAATQLIALAKDTSHPRRQKKAFFWLARSRHPAVQSFLESILR